METSTKTDTFVLKLAVKIFAHYGKQWEAYESDCESYAKDGYRPAHCFHGTALWVDYDVMCGACEEGYGWFDPMLYRQLALAEAKGAYKSFDERLDIYTKVSSMGAPGIDYGQLIAWVAQPLRKWDAAIPANTAVSTDPPF